MAAMVSVPFGHTRVNRIAPDLPPAAFKTYGMAMPLATHWRPATCDEVECEAYRCGWVTTVDLSTELGQRQAHYIRRDSSRHASEQQESLTLVRFTYAPGQRCFSYGEHRLPVGRPARFYVAEGDWRGNPRGLPTRAHARAEDWVDDFATHQDKLATAIQRG